MARAEMRIGGFGGQGVILAGMIIGRSASIYDKKFATMIQSFGPEARGSSCSAQLIVSDTQVMYPYTRKLNLLVAMSQDAYVSFDKILMDQGVLLYESDFVKPAGLRKTIKSFGIPATRFAEEIGKKMVANIVMIGFFTSVLDLLTADGARNAVKDSIPKGTEDLNLRAFDKGFEYGRSLVPTPLKLS